jgi:hypothetical protein
VAALCEGRRDEADATASARRGKLQRPECTAQRTTQWRQVSYGAPL